MNLTKHIKLWRSVKTQLHMLLLKEMEFPPKLPKSTPLTLYPMSFENIIRIEI